MSFSMRIRCGQGRSSVGRRHVYVCETSVRVGAFEMFGEMPPKGPVHAANATSQRGHGHQVVAMGW